jgi:hypothetical protein
MYVGEMGSKLFGDASEDGISEVLSAPLRVD